MKPSPISVVMLVVSLFLAPALLAQTPASVNQSAASPAPAAAEVPRLIKFSGTLLDALDRPLAGPVGVTFALYKEQERGAALWMETQNVTPDAHGLYTVFLGANSAHGVPAELFASGEARWLEVQVERQAEQPRVLLVSVPYALKAADADTLGGKPLSAFVTTSQAAGGSGSASGKRSASAGVALPAVGGTGSMNMVAKWVDNAGNLGNSTITDDGTNVSMTGNAGALAYKFTGNAALPSDPTATILNAAGVGPVFSGLSFKVRTGLTAPADALSIDFNRNVSMTGNASALTYKFSGNAALPTDATATILNAANIGPVFSGFSFRVRTGSPPADALSVDPSQNVSVVGGNLLIGAGKAIVFSDGSVLSKAASGVGGGTITGVTAGTGLTGGGASGGVTLNIANGGVTNAMLAANSVTNANVADGSLSQTKIAGVAATLGANLFTGNQSITGNLALTGTANVIALGGTFDGPNGGVFGRDTINDGTNRFGVLGAAASTGGAGVVGTSTAATGQAAGVRGFAASTGGAGVFGQASNSTGVTAGVRGVASSPSGRGVSGDMVAATANTAIAGGSGVAGTYGFNQDGSVNANATAGFGVFGQNTAPDGTGVNAVDFNQCLLPACDPSLTGTFPVGLSAQVLHANGFAVVGTAGSPTVGCALPACDPTKTGNVGVFGRSFHPNGAGIAGVARDTSVTTGGVFSAGVFARAFSPTSYALDAYFSPATVDVGAAGLFNNDAGSTAPTPSKLCTGAAACTILDLQANGTREFHFDGAGNAHAAGTFVGGGADFAESVSVRGERQLYEAGDVMVIDDAGNRSLAKAQEPYSTLVAGIVSTKPGVLASLHNSTTSAGQKAIEAEVPLAVVGIVPCKVSAENGPIHAGDLLVTSSTAGYAMKGTDRARMLGAVVGKALQPMESGKGVIEVLVTLQ